MAFSKETRVAVRDKYILPIMITSDVPQGPVLRPDHLRCLLVDFLVKLNVDWLQYANDLTLWLFDATPNDVVLLQTSLVVNMQIISMEYAQQPRLLVRRLVNCQIKKSSVHAIYLINQSINHDYFQINIYKNEQKVQFAVIHVQRRHVHPKEHSICKTKFTN